MNTNIFPQDDLKNLEIGLALAGLFEHLPKTYLYVKNAKSQFLHVNQRFLKLLGANRLEDVLGKTDHDFFPRHLADEYRKEDLGVIQGTIKVVEKIWLVPRPNKKLDWFFSTKLPIFAPQNVLGDSQFVGLVGYIRDCKESDLGSEQDIVAKKVADFILENYSQHISSQELAKIASLSVSQMNRRFHQAYQVSPQQFLLSVRVKIASQLLATTEESITSIVADTGFFDQSHFSRYFRRSFDMSPNEFRNQYQDFVSR